MAVMLSKDDRGKRVSLAKVMNVSEEEFRDKKVGVAVGWDENPYDSSNQRDLDLVVFACDEHRRCVNENYFVFYNNLKTPDGAITHSGDNRTGEGDGDDELVFIDFSKMSAEVKSIVLAVTIFEAKARGQNFGMVDNSYIRLFDKESGEQFLRYDLGEDFDSQTSLVMAEIYENRGSWKFRAIGEGYEKELIDFCHEYGIEVG